MGFSGHQLQGEGWTAEDISSESPQPYNSHGFGMCCNVRGFRGSEGLGPTTARGRHGNRSASRKGRLQRASNTVDDINLQYKSALLIIRSIP